MQLLLYLTDNLKRKEIYFLEIKAPSIRATEGSISESQMPGMWATSLCSLWTDTPLHWSQLTLSTPAPAPGAQRPKPPEV